MAKKQKEFELAAATQATAKAARKKADDEAKARAQHLEDLKKAVDAKAAPPVPPEHPSLAPGRRPTPQQAPQEVTGTSAMATVMESSGNYKANGAMCEAYGCRCDHMSPVEHNVAVDNNNAARANYRAQIDTWGPNWSVTQWHQEHACTTTGSEGTKKSLYSKEDMEIMGICWAKALHHAKMTNPLTGECYEGYN